MKLRNKLFLVVGLTCIISLIVGAMSEAFYKAFNPFAVLGLVASFAIIVLGVLYALLIKKVDQASENPDIQLVSQLKSEDNEFFKYDERKNSFYKFAHYDKFISLPNRVLFNEILNKSISHARRHQKTLAIMLVHVSLKDSTKHLNETIAKELGQRFSKVLRNEDVISMLDHEQFIVLLTDINKPKFASVAAEKIIKVCTQGIEVHHKKIMLNTNIGICIYPSDGDSLEQLIENVYQALYESQKINLNHYHFHSKNVDAEAHEYVSLESDLKNSIQNKELTLYYQPKLDVKTGNIVGVEALVRWIHPKLGMIYPEKFIPVAEDSGFIVKLGEWALLLACLTNKYWQDNGFQPMSVALNLSPKQFYHENVLSMIKNALRATGLKPQYLELEVTESTIMVDTEKAKEILQSLKEMGVQISIDHFGTGYTSINHFKDLPITTVKIDQNYVKGIPNNAIDTALTGAMINLGHSLGLKVVAEGVETAEQLQFISQQNCDIVQGYFLSYPVSANNIVEQFTKVAEKEEAVV